MKYQDAFALAAGVAAQTGETVHVIHDLRGSDGAPAESYEVAGEVSYRMLFPGARIVTTFRRCLKPGQATPSA